MRKLSHLQKVKNFVPGFRYDIRTYLYTVPKILYVNRIIKLFLILLKGRRRKSKVQILECANIWFSRFPDFFKVENCIEFAIVFDIIEREAKKIKSANPGMRKYLVLEISRLF